VVKVELVLVSLLYLSLNDFERRLLSVCVYTMR
jgi:hypothetical protein